MTTTNDFYDAMKVLKEIRSQLLNNYLSRGEFSKDLVSKINAIQNDLITLPKADGFYRLRTKTSETLSVELDYELNELEKDNVFFEQGIEGLKAHLTASHPNFDVEVQQGLSFLKDNSFDYFFTDRDGTISNYCGRYLSSVQGVGNALMLSQVSKTINDRSVVITAAPLLKEGLNEVSILPKGDFILAGSKGREFLVESAHYFSLPIEDEKQAMLDQLYTELQDLLKQKEYSIFNYIGSGLQQKFGEVALARQNKDYSIPEEKSLAFKSKVIECIKKVDPEGNTLVLDDTGKDLEINLSHDESNGKDFNKGNGIEFIVETLGLHLKNKTVLICGDTFSDVPMLNAAQDFGARVYTIFVTQNEDLKQRVRSAVDNAFFVTSPDVLVHLLYEYARI